jgi:uncharacterized protein YdaU (DUF1376 family)
MQPTTTQSEITLSQRRGKIARLPRAVREQINVLLDDGLEAAEILPWLNDLPHVRQIITERFNGVPVSEQNLSGWRQGGFQEWLLHRELLDSASHSREDVEELNETLASDSPDGIPHPLADFMVAKLTLHLTRFMRRWNGGPGDVQLLTLLKIGQFILKLQQAAYRAEKEVLERRKLKDLADLKEAERLRMMAAWPVFLAQEAKKEEAEKLRLEKKARKAARRKARVQTPSSAGQSSPVKVNKGSSADQASRPESTEPTLVENVEFGQDRKHPSSSSNTSPPSFSSANNENRRLNSQPEM